MSEQYLKAVKAINEVTLFFATEGYHVTTSFGAGCHSMDVCVYFYDIEDKKKIEHLLSCYTKQNDAIEFRDFSHEGKRAFYTLTLQKYTL